jgi:hypothetical protein
MAGGRKSKYQRRQSRPTQLSASNPTQNSRCAKVTYLGATVARQSVVPQALVRSSYGRLVSMVSMSQCTNRQKADSKSSSQHDGILAVVAIKV